MKKREMFQVDDDIDFCFDLWTVEWIKTHPKESVALSQTTSKEQNLFLTKQFAISTRGFARRIKLRERYYQGKKISFEDYCVQFKRFQGEKLSLLESKEMYERFLYTLENEVIKLSREIQTLREEKKVLDEKSNTLKKQEQAILCSIEQVEKTKKEWALRKIPMVLGTIRDTVLFSILLMGGVLSLNFSYLLMIPLLGIEVPIIFLLKKDIKRILLYKKAQKKIKTFEEQKVERDKKRSDIQNDKQLVDIKDKECTQKLDAKEQRRNQLLIQRAHYKIIYNFHFEKREDPFDLSEDEKVKVLK